MNAELFEAVERDDKLPVLRFLEKEGDVNTRDEYGDKTLLMIACLRNSKNIVYLLVTNSAAVNETSIRRCTPLMMAARKGNEDIVELLLKAKDIDVIAKNSWGMTAIHHAARCNYATILEKLLSFPVPVDIVDIENRTPLWFAASCGYLSCVDVLLKRGANPLHESKTQNSPLEIAKQNGYTHVVEKMEEAIRVTSHPYVEGYMSVIRQQDQQKIAGLQSELQQKDKEILRLEIAANDKVGDVYKVSDKSWLLSQPPGGVMAVVSTLACNQWSDVGFELGYEPSELMSLTSGVDAPSSKLHFILKTKALAVGEEKIVPLILRACQRIPMTICAQAIRNKVAQRQEESKS